ncbi:hypothetical protein COR50_19580 [Chitinophaga caeni]|uniref:DUF5689 domain-containing protein n=2 Tax=Chitinophaga caeni TaxID=2029983 RepID=A0A291R1I8_9BACT|nr:hypothetical protein COR50_19580 [Chitinophaga caeni]
MAETLIHEPYFNIQTSIMKHFKILSLLLFTMVAFWSCEKDNYPGAKISPFIAIYDLKTLYKGNDVKLTTGNMFGSDYITGVVVSDHSGGNMPEGLIAVQDRRRLNQLRGIAIPLGDEAKNFLPGDSIVVNVNGATLSRVNGIMQLLDVPLTSIQKVSSGNEIPVNRITTADIISNPDKYESTLGVIVKGGFDPLPAPTDVLSGDKLLNDGFGDITLHTNANASFADSAMPVSANFYGIVFNKMIGDSLAPVFNMRSGDDYVTLSSTIEITPIIITGFISDVKGGDGNYEYIQMMATQDIDFSKTPFSVVVTNNANASTPTGYPANGWATGDKRTYKINMSSGFAAKGTFFYVGGTGKSINGSGSTSIASSNWIRSYDYVNNDGDDFGRKTGGLFANSGNASGLAVFRGTEITVDTKPVDVIFISSGGSLYTAGPPEKGYKITNTDWYDVRNPITLENQPYYKSGANTLCMTYTTKDVGYFYVLGGEYNVKLGKWVKARTQSNVELTKESTLIEIEGEGATILKQ